MVDQRPSRVWLMRGLYLWLAVTVIFLQLLPLETMPRSWASADFLLAITFAWAMSRPEYVPALSIGAVLLLADFLLQRPPGLQAALVVIAAEVLSRRARANRDMPYVAEWLTVSGGILAVLIAYRIMLGIFFLPPPPLGLTLIQAGATIAVYPIVVLISHLVLGVRRPAPGEVDALGHKL